MHHRKTDGLAARALITASAAAYVCNVAFGTAVARGFVDNSRIRWVHHALFIATATLTAAALVVGAVRRRPSWWSLLPAAPPLAVLPYAGGRLARHTSIASVAGPAYLTSLVLSWRRR
jgi:hypothetical protein